jgi:hypothetical protein
MASASKGAERSRIYYQSFPRESRDRNFHEAANRILIDHSRPDENRVGASRTLDRAGSGLPVEQAVGSLRQCEDARFGDGHTKRRDNTARTGELKCSGARAQRRDTSQQKCARNFRRATDDQHSSAILFIRVHIRLRKLPPPQKRCGYSDWALASARRHWRRAATSPARRPPRVAPQSCKA